MVVVAVVVEPLREVRQRVWAFLLRVALFPLVVLALEPVVWQPLLRPLYGQATVARRHRPLYDPVYHLLGRRLLAYYPLLVLPLLPQLGRRLAVGEGERFYRHSRVARKRPVGRVAAKPLLVPHRFPLSVVLHLLVFLRRRHKTPVYALRGLQRVGLAAWPPPVVLRLKRPFA